VGVAIGRRHLNPAQAVVETVIDDNSEPQLIDVESQAAVLIAHVDDGEVQAEIRIFIVDPQKRPVYAKWGFVGSHRRAL